LTPSNITEYWKESKSFHLAVYDSRQSTNIKTLLRGKQVADFVNYIQPDIIYFEDTSLRIALGSLLFPKIPWVIGVHDPESHSGGNYWRYSLTEKLMYSKTKQIILHNETQRKDFIERHHIPPEIVNVIPLGIYDGYLELATRVFHPMSNNILFFGRLSSYKGLKVLFDAAVCVSKKVENVTFAVVGKPSQGYEMPQIPELAHGGKFVFHLEHVPAAAMGDYFLQAACVVCPYLEATQSGVVLTSYAFNKPVIATRTGGLPEYVLDGQTGLLVEPNDSQGLADAIIQYLNNDELRETLLRGIVEIRQGLLNWDQICNQYKKVFDEVLQ
jgi:glycosyltransferase involved in cell wall biosynthesis